MNGGKGVRKLIEKVYTKQAGSWDDPSTPKKGNRRKIRRIKPRRM